MPQKTIFITGSTDGIGLALARLYRERGWRVVTHGRRQAQPNAPGHLHILADLERDDCAGRIVDSFRAANITEIDVLVHNAAAAWVGDVAEQTESGLRQMMQVNLIAPILLTHALFPLLRQAQGTVAFVSSVVAHVPAPSYAIYAASKAALDALARSLTEECRAEGIRVLTIWPGGTRTGLHGKAGFTATQIAKMRLISAEDAAARIARRIDRNSSGTLSFPMTLATWIGRKFPTFTDRCARRLRRANLHAVAPVAESRILITGHAAGIGQACARAFLAAGAQVCGVDVDASPTMDRECALPGVVADLSDPAGVAAVAKFQGEWQPHRIVHNAGINATGPFWEIDPARLRKVVEINLLAPLILTCQALSLKPVPAFVFISSLSKQLAYPGASVYAATKAGVAQFARSLRAAGVGVLTVYPGPTRTRHAEEHSPDNSKAASRMPPEELAGHIVKAAAQSRAELIPGWKNKLLAAFGHWFPHLAAAAMRKALFEKMPRRSALNADESAPSVDREARAR